MKTILASANAHKALEFNRLFRESCIDIIPAEAKIAVEETGKSYEENAFLKASAYYAKYQQPCMADDSGLNVKSLPGLLGVESSRFAPECKTQDEKNDYLLKLLEGNSQREASFSCVLCFYLKPEEIYFFEGCLKGKISLARAGEEGFGYDPIFIPEGKAKSLAQCPEWKNQHSHRARACQQASIFFEEG